MKRMEMNKKNICKVDNILQKAGKYKTVEMHRIHKKYSDAIHEEEILKKLLTKQQYDEVYF